MGGQDITPTVFLIQDFQKATLGRATSVRCLAYSPSSRLLALGSEDMQVTVWDVPADKILSSEQNGVPMSQSAATLLFASDCFGKSVVACLG